MISFSILYFIVKLIGNFNSHCRRKCCYINLFNLINHIFEKSVNGQFYSSMLVGSKVHRAFFVQTKAAKSMVGVSISVDTTQSLTAADYIKRRGKLF